MVEEQYFHSVKINKALCQGCTACVKNCPTAAIRVRKGKAEIIASRCIDCGTCVKVCSFHAAMTETDSLSRLQDYKYNIVLPPPSLYAQFPERVSAGVIWQCLHDLGFDEIFDVGLASEYIGLEIENYLKNYQGKRKPLISCTCPTVLRLIQIQFPELIKQVIPLLPPGEAAAIYVKERAVRLQGLPPEQIGVWFITACPSKTSNIRQSVDVLKPQITGCFSVSEIYALLMKHISSPGSGQRRVSTGSSYGLGWGAYGGEVRAAGIDNALVVHGLKDVHDVLEQISLNKMPTLDYVECSACQGGCIGGPLAAENKFVAETNLKRRMELLRQHEPATREETLALSMDCPDFPCSKKYTKKLMPRPMMQLDDNILEAMKKFEKMEDVLQSLPGLDCGACGAPSCQGLAEDIVQGKASEIDCIFKLRASVKKIARGMLDLAKEMPLSDVTGDEEDNEEDGHEGK